MPKHSLSRAQPAPDDSRDESYVPKTPSNWTDPDPRTVGKALDDLGERRGEFHIPMMDVGTVVSF